MKNKLLILIILVQVSNTICREQNFHERMQHLMTLTRSTDPLEIYRLYPNIPLIDIRILARLNRILFSSEQEALRENNP